MPSFLITRKMSPELALRIATSVSGRRPVAQARVRPRAVSLLRFAVIATLVFGVCSIAWLRQRSASRLEQERALLSQYLAREAASIGPSDYRNLERASLWLETAAGVYAGDLVAEGLRAPGALRDVLSREALYVRGALGSLRTASGLAASAASSQPDALVLCLVDPPAARTEKALLGRTRVSYAAGERMREATGHVHRLHHAQSGLPLLAPAFRARIVAAEDQELLERLRREIERAPLAAARRAAKARLLLFAIDEPADQAGPVELDGERPHEVRVGLVDLATEKQLLRLRRRVDPSFISAGPRAEYASGIDSCALALDIREAVLGAVATR